MTVILVSSDIIKSGGIPLIDDKQAVSMTLIFKAIKQQATVNTLSEMYVVAIEL